jgi:alpha-glucosidase
MTHWWQRGVIYQIYPRSFQDESGDGVGDLAGIRRRLPYLAELGIDAIWLSPIFPSPMADFGYDICDYIDVEPLFGSLAEFDALLAEAHRANIRVILDLVPNHTSDRHPWFIESRASRQSRKRDWYIWKDPAPDGGPPNNWLSEFGGSAWQYDQPTRQYYCHTFLAAQPDLNWRNLEVRRALYDVMRFWLRRGVDGFRVDVIWHLIKDPPNHALIPLYTADRPEVHDIIREMRGVVDEFPERLLIGEIYLPVERRSWACLIGSRRSYQLRLEIYHHQSKSCSYGRKIRAARVGIDALPFGSARVRGGGIVERPSLALPGRSGSDAARSMLVVHCTEAACRRQASAGAFHVG